MGAIVVTNDLAAATVTYNTVQFGGNDADYKSVPPTYRFRGQFVYDDSNRAIKGVQYSLMVNAIFYENNEAAMATNAEAMRRLLSKPGKQLKIVGLGTGFATISNDIAFGPKPISYDWQPLGQAAWEMVWLVSFHIMECGSNNSPNTLAAFNFDTTWQNDFEGMCARTIAGHAEIAPRLGGPKGKTPMLVADQVRTQITVIVPAGFRRTSNVWRENDAKNRLEFVITDEQEPGDPLPQGIIQASGNLSYDSAGPGFAKAVVTLNINLRVAPGFPPGLGGQTALIIAKTKHQQMLAANGVNQRGQGTVIARGMSITAGKWANARETSARFSWDMTKCVAAMMTAAGIWQPLNTNTMQQWQASVSNLWGNRGVAGLGSVANEGVIIDLCDNVTNVTIGATPNNYNTNQLQPQFTFSCPDVPTDGGWIGHDLRLSVKRIDNQTAHRKAIAYLPTVDLKPFVNALAGRGVPIPGSVFTTNSQSVINGKHDIEYHGNPDVYVLLEFRGLRLIRQPQMPELLSIGGVKAEPVGEAVVDGPRIAYDSPCPVYFIRGYQLYRINGYIAEIKAVESNSSCALSNGNNQTY